MSPVTVAPLPSLRALLALAGGGEPNDATLGARWAPNGGTVHFFSRASFGLAAIVASRTSPLLYLPDYFCNAATIPARRVGARLAFYPIDETLAPDWGRVEAMATADKPDLFLQVHYFGRPADLAPARAFCDRFGAALIEDAAHAVMPGAAIGQGGDYVLWSLYKHLAIPDGGLLVARRPIDSTAPPTAPSPWIWLAKRLMQKCVPPFARALRKAPLEFARDPAPDEPGPAALSHTARRMIATADLAAIAQRRVAAERALRETLDLPPLLPASDGSWAPYRAVFRATESDYDRFVATRFPVETWPDLPPEVRADPERHATALALRNATLTLPCEGDARALARSARRARRQR